MKNFVFLFCIIGLLSISCGGSRKVSNASKSKSTISSSSRILDKKAKKIISYAKSFKGTKYKYGGTTKKGMDCSGLIYTSFKKEQVLLPRTSRAMATQGKKVSLKQVQAGDLLFFKTSKNKKVINHVGLVVAVGNTVDFIHASTSRGVIISNLSEKYWNNCFVGAKRIL